VLACACHNDEEAMAGQADALAYAQENLGSFNFTLSQAEMETLNKM
jgi:hypothetical protein